MARNRREIGAIVTFTGLCRDEDGQLAALELEHYPGMAQAEISRMAKQALERWPLNGLTIIHRYGLIKPGENIVLVVAASRRSTRRFRGRFVSDGLYENQCAFLESVEHLADGTAGGWVSSKEED